MDIVVVGGGLAGAKAVEELRTKGFDGGITLVGEESHLPYERPPLSKDLLLGKAEPDSATVLDREWYDDNEVRLQLGAPVTAIDTGRHRIVVDDHEIGYDKLLLAMGSSPRRLPMADDSGVEPLYLRTLEDSRALKDSFSGHLLLIGAGWIGLEVAAAARLAGAEVTVVELADLPLAHVLGNEVAGMFADLHRQHGVDLRLGTSVDGLTRGDRGTDVTLGDGSTITVDHVVVGIGAVPNDALAARAGIATDHGVLVDATLRTDAPDVFAAGDVANHDHPVLGRRIRVEHWDTAIQQGRHAARAMLGDEEPYTRQPYFFTDQYDLGMEYVGHAHPDDVDEVVIRGDLTGGRVMNALWLKGDRVVAGMHANDWDAIGPLRRLVGSTADARTRDPGIPLGDLAAE